MSDIKKFDGVKVKVTSFELSHDKLLVFKEDRGEFEFDTFEAADGFATQYVDSVTEYVEVEVSAYYKTSGIKKPEPAMQIPREEETK